MPNMAKKTSPRVSELMPKERFLNRRTSSMGCSARSCHHIKTDKITTLTAATSNVSPDNQPLCGASMMACEGSAVRGTNMPATKRQTITIGMLMVNTECQEKWFNK